MELHQRRVRLGVKKSFFAREWWGTGTGFPVLWSQLQAAVIQGTFVQCFQIQDLDFGWSCVELGVGPDDPYGSFPSWDILGFYNLSYLFTG